MTVATYAWKLHVTSEKWHLQAAFVSYLFQLLVVSEILQLQLVIVTYSW